MAYFLYVLLITVLINLGDKQRNKSIMYRIFACVAFIFFVGFRKYTVGVDSESYQELYYLIPNENYVWIEIGFDWLVRLLDTWGCEYNAMYLACITLTALPIFFVLEYSPSYKMTSFMMYVFTLSTVCNGMRQCIAVGLFILSTLFIQNRKILPFIACMGGALLFHYTSIILWPLYYVLHRTTSPKIYKMIYVISFIFIFVDPNFLIRPIVEHISFLGREYTESSLHIEQLSWLGFIYSTFINFMIFGVMLKMNAFKRHTVLANCTFVALVLKNLSFNMVIMGRIIMYFGWFQYFIIPIMICELNQSKSAKHKIMLAVISVLMIGFIHNLFSSEMHMYPYEYCFKLLMS